jgi:hypothetical protein
MAGASALIVGSWFPVRRQATLSADLTNRRINEKGVCPKQTPFVRQYVILDKRGNAYPLTEKLEL